MLEMWGTFSAMYVEQIQPEPLPMQSQPSILTTMASTTLVLPGDVISQSALPQSSKKALTLGPGLRHTPPSTITATAAGSLSNDPKKNALWVETNGGRVRPLPTHFHLLNLVLYAPIPSETPTKC